MATSTPSLMMWWAAIAMACRPDEQNRFTVVPAVVTGSPERTAATRAMLWPCGPCGWPQPRMTSSTSLMSSWGTFPSASLMQCAARSSGRVRLKDPRNDFASGVRELATTTASLMVGYLSRRGLYRLYPILAGLGALRGAMSSVPDRPGLRVRRRVDDEDLHRLLAHGGEDVRDVGGEEHRVPRSQLAHGLVADLDTRTTLEHVADLLDARVRVLEGATTLLHGAEHDFQLRGAHVLATDEPAIHGIVMVCGRVGRDVLLAHNVARGAHVDRIARGDSAHARSTSATVFGVPAVRMSQPVSVMTTSSSIRMPMPRYSGGIGCVT